MSQSQGIEGTGKEVSEPRKNKRRVVERTQVGFYKDANSFLLKMGRLRLRMGIDLS